MSGFGVCMWDAGVGVWGRGEGGIVVVLYISCLIIMCWEDFSLSSNLFGVLYASCTLQGSLIFRSGDYS